MTEESSCAVCHQPIPQGRVHYGGVSCYSCRAFFRRNTQREELPVCKGAGECSITYIDRKQCSSCRYDKCIRIGMRPELVLTENDKKRRFKKLIRKKEEEAVNALASSELSHTKEDFLHARVHNIPALQPIQTGHKNPIPFSSRIPFSNSTATFAQNMCSLKYPNRSQYWNMIDMDKTKHYNWKNQEFVSEMRSEVQNYVKNKKYEKIHQPLYSQTPYNFKASSRAFPYPLSPRAIPNTYMPCGLASPNENLYQDYANYTKDFPAKSYFENKGELLENFVSLNSVSTSSTTNSYSVSPHSPVSYSTSTPSSVTYSSSPPSSVDYSTSPPSPVSHSTSPPSPVDYSTSPPSPVSHSTSPPSHSSYFNSSHSTVSYPVSYLSEQFPSYISYHNPVSVIKSQNQDTQYTSVLRQADSTDTQFKGVLRQTQDESKQRQIKLEPEDKEDDCDKEPEEYMQQDTYYENEEVTKEDGIENDILMFNYVHKKFRTHLENSKILSETNILQNRKSVIFHASSAKAICVS